MIESIGYSRKPQTIGGAMALVVYPLGKDKKGKRNA